MSRQVAVVAVMSVSLGALVAGDPPRPAVVSPPFDPARAVALRSEWASRLGLRPEVTNSLGMKLLLIPGGRFDMGPTGSKHRVTLSSAFYLGETEVTLKHYRAWKPGHRVDGAEESFNHDDMPAAMVSWHDARAFCAWLSEQAEEKAAGRMYALPTEAQWEWAARAGTVTNSFFGDVEKDRSLEQQRVRYAWYNHTYTPNPARESGGRGRHPVARLSPNAWGLYDLYGNVWEWCEDRRGDTATGESRDPVIRGGGWRSGGFHCTSVSFDPADVNARSDQIGFRVAGRIVRPGD